MWSLSKITVGIVVNGLKGTELIELKTSLDEQRLICVLLYVWDSSFRLGLMQQGIFPGKVVFTPEDFPSGTYHLSSIITQGHRPKKGILFPIDLFHMFGYWLQRYEGFYLKNKTTAAKTHLKRIATL